MYSVKVIQLTRNQKAKVDDEDFAYLNQWKWYCNNTGYAGREHYMGDYKRKTLLMHRVILQAQQGQEVDHINGDRLDNRKSNLRFVTRTQNLQNRSWKMKGVSKKSNKTRGQKRWVARINIDGKTKFLGDYFTPEEAERAYLNAVKEHFGEYGQWTTIFKA